MTQDFQKAESHLQEALSIISSIDQNDPANPDLIAVYDQIEGAIKKVQKLRESP